MLKDIEVERKPNGKPVIIPVKISDANIEQQIKLLIEIADYNLFDAHMHLSVFRHFHGGEWTSRLLQEIIQELHQPGINLKLSHARDKLVPFFTSELSNHQGYTDEAYRYPPDDVWRLPL
jgi:hypothetical protein